MTSSLGLPLLCAVLLLVVQEDFRCAADDAGQLQNSAFRPTSTTTIAELGYAFDEHETRGLLAGVQYTNVFFDSNPSKVDPTVIGYLGGTTTGS